MIRADVARELPARAAQAPEAGVSDDVNATELKSYVGRVQRLREEQAALAEDLKALYKEARDNGFEPAIIREVVKILAQDPDKRAEHDAILELYLSAVGTSH